MQAIANAIGTYIQSGSTAPLMGAWPGDLLQRAEQSRHDLRGALIEEVLRRTAGLSHPPLPTHDPRQLVRRRVLPMLSGLFPAAEREAVLTLVESSVIFVTNANFKQLLMEQRWDHTAWALANLHLGTLGAELLGSGPLAWSGSARKRPASYRRST